MAEYFIRPLQLGQMSSLLLLLCVLLQDMASFKIAALQKALDDSVPASELELANKQYTELTEKYRDKLESTKSLVAFKEEASGYQVGIYRCIVE